MIARNDLYEDTMPQIGSGKNALWIVRKNVRDNEGYMEWYRVYYTPEDAQGYVDFEMECNEHIYKVAKRGGERNHKWLETEDKIKYDYAIFCINLKPKDWTKKEKAKQKKDFKCVLDCGRGLMDWRLKSKED